MTRTYFEIGAGGQLLVVREIDGKRALSTSLWLWQSLKLGRRKAVNCASQQK